MLYEDTRGMVSGVKFGDVLFAGTAPGKGLYMPKRYTPVDMSLACGLSYPALATLILYSDVSDVISFEDLDELTHEVFTAENFGTKEITPIDWLEENRLGRLELSNGPTLAFKDQAMKIVAKIMSTVLKRLGRTITIVVATSGDTGGAAVDAFKGLENITLVVLFPSNGRVSAVQRRMMTTSGAANVHALAVEGTFDDCQAIVKALFDEERFRQFREEMGLTGVNSINWTRIAAQVVYWFSASVQVLNRGVAHLDITVPTGNFGNVFSAYVAKKRGAPIRRIIVASNQNDVLFRALDTGIYEPAESVVPTTSPSMDIQVSSNFERLLFEGANRDGEVVRGVMDTLSATGKVAITSLLHSLEDWHWGRTTEEEVRKTIKLVHDRYDGRIIDPHTAVAMHVALQHQSRAPMIVAETAKPHKFPDLIRDVLDIDLEMPAAWKSLDTLRERVKGMSTDAEDVRQYILDNVHV